jgi:divalent metal cation (Fe/Co/Zn/Cd) transporter
MPMGRAHAIATDFERAIRDEFGADVEIETHIDPMSPHVMAGVDIDPVAREEIIAAVRHHALEVGWLGDIHDVRARETSGGWVVNFHCRVDPAVAVEIVHQAVDQVERRMLVQFPEILRIVGHAEPEDHG